MAQVLVDQVEASVEEAVNSATWTDLQVSLLQTHMWPFPSQIQAFSASWLSLFLVLAGPAQLPLHGGRGDAHHPGHEEHKRPVLGPGAGRDRGRQ